MLLTSTSQLSSVPQRIISVVPSQTELLHYFGLEAETVGITKFCVHPEEWFRSKTRIGGTKTIDIEKVRTLNPDLIIANKEENVKQQIMQLAQDFPVWVTDVNHLEDALGMMGDVGKLTGKEIIARQLTNEIETRFSAINDLAAQNQKRRTAYLIWKDPYMAAGTDTYISSILQVAGLTNAFSHRTRYPEISIAALQTERCDLILLSSEPYPFKQKHIDELQAQLPQTKILLVDGEMFSWYGPRLLDVPEYLRCLI